MVLKIVRFIALFAGFSTASAANTACPLAASAPARTEAGPVQISWTTTPNPVQVGEPILMRLTLCPADAKLERVDAVMPEHRHGMNYKATFASLGDGVWEVKGMVWHMSGRWELRVDARLGEKTQRITQSITLP